MLLKCEVQKQVVFTTINIKDVLKVNSHAMLHALKIRIETELFQVVY